MPNLPAVCDQCGTMFPSGVELKNVDTFTLGVGRSGPCPHCGGWGHVANGTFRVTENAIEVLQGTQRTRSELERFAQLIHEAREQGASAEELGETIRREMPELQGIADILPQPRAELYAFLTVLIAALTLMASQSGGHGEEGAVQPPVTLEQVIDEAMLVPGVESAAVRSPLLEADDTLREPALPPYEAARIHAQVLHVDARDTTEEIAAALRANVPEGIVVHVRQSTSDERWIPPGSRALHVIFESVGRVLEGTLAAVLGAWLHSALNGRAKGVRIGSKTHAIREDALRWALRDFSRHNRQ